MNTASLKLVLNGAKQTKGLLDKYKQDRERKNFDAVDALRRSMMTEDERDAMLANSPAHIRAVAEYMRKQDGAAKALDKARALALAYEHNHDNGLASSETAETAAPATKASGAVATDDEPATPVASARPVIDIAAAKTAAAQLKEKRVNKNCDLSTTIKNFRKRAAAAATEAQGQAAGLAAQAADLVSEKTGVDKKDLEKRTAKLRKKALKNTKSQRKALAKNRKAAAKQGAAFKKQAAAQTAALKDQAAAQFAAGQDALAPRIEAGREATAARGAAFAAAASQALDTAKERGVELEKDVANRAAAAEKNLQKRAAEAKKRTAKAQKQAAKDAKKNKKAFLKNKKKFNKDVNKRKAKAAKKADKVLAQKGLKKQKKSNNFGLILLVLALAAGAAAAFKFLTTKKDVPASTPKIQDFKPSATGAAAKAKATDAIKAQDMEAAADKAVVTEPETVEPAVEVEEVTPVAEPALDSEVVTEEETEATTDEAQDDTPKPSQMPGAPGVPSAPGAPAAPTVHHAQGKDAETTDSEAVSEHDAEGEFPDFEDEQDDNDEGGRHRL